MVKRSGTASDEEIQPPQKKRKRNVDGTEFSQFRISDDMKKKLDDRGYKHLLPVQASTFDIVYDGRDVVTQARTGTGKTLSYALPLVEKLAKKQRRRRGRQPKILVLAPTRELARQVNDEFVALAPELSTCCIYGGVSYESQVRAIADGIDVVVGTPGRILDLCKRQLNLKRLKHVVLDEADCMLEIGFADDVDEILQEVFEKHKPQMLLFSATVPPWVTTTAQKYMNDDRVVVDMIGKDKLKTAVTVEHKAIRCTYDERASVIGDVIQVFSGTNGQTMIFTDMKKDANELALNSCLKQECQVLHGDIQQAQREVTLASFRQGKFPCLVATNVAARGLDIPEVDLVIQCEPPKDVEAYIHRAGRTGRAGKSGTCVVFYKPNQEYLLKLVERKAGIEFNRIGPPQPADIIAASAQDAAKSIQAIPSTVISQFHSAAETLLVTMKPVNAVAAALAHISGSLNTIQSRSLLTSQPNFTTYHLTNAFEFRTVSYMWKAIELHLPSEVKGAVRGMRMCQNMKGVVFDLPSSLNELVKTTWKDGVNTKLSVANELPPLVDRDRTNQQRPAFSRNSFQKQQSNGLHNGQWGKSKGGNGIRSNQRNGQWNRGSKR
jgi:ATP-dependent RNA helicase DDX21